MQEGSVISIKTPLTTIWVVETERRAVGFRTVHSLNTSACTLCLFVTFVAMNVASNETAEISVMAEGKFISYLRVSTAKQGRSGLGVEAQRKAVEDYLNGGSWKLIDEVVEIESGKRDDRPKLSEALRLCRMHGATLVIAKLDRLARDAHFLLGLQKAGVRFVAADMPEANEMVVGIMAVVAQAERNMISARTKTALAQKKKFYETLTEEQRAALRAGGKAVRLGGDRGNIHQIAAKGREASRAVRSARADAKAADITATISEIRNSGAGSLREIAAALNARNIPTPRKGAWSATQVARVLERMKAAA